MKFPGYWVVKTQEEVTICRTEFDETELDPKTDWKEACVNQDNESLEKGFVNEEDALNYVKILLRG